MRLSIASGAVVLPVWVPVVRSTSVIVLPGRVTSRGSASVSVGVGVGVGVGGGVGVGVGVLLRLGGECLLALTPSMVASKSPPMLPGVFVLKSPFIVPAPGPLSTASRWLPVIIP